MQHPFGFFITDGVLEIDPNEFPAVEYALALREQRHTIRAIAAAMNAANFSNRAGGPFNATQVHRLLARAVRREIV